MLLHIVMDNLQQNLTLELTEKLWMIISLFLVHQTLCQFSQCTIRFWLILGLSQFHSILHYQCLSCYFHCASKHHVQPQYLFLTQPIYTNHSSSSSLQNTLLSEIVWDSPMFKKLYAGQLKVPISLCIYQYEHALITHSK